MLLVVLLAVRTHIVAEAIVAEVLTGRCLVFVALFGLESVVVRVKESGFGFIG